MQKLYSHQSEEVFLKRGVKARQYPRFKFHSASSTSLKPEMLWAERAMVETEEEAEGLVAIKSV